MLQTINKVTDCLKSVSSIEAVYIVGSFANGVTIHDIDMLLIGNEMDRQELQHCLVENLGATAVFANDDSIACRIDGVDFDFALLSVEALLRRAEDITQMQLFAEHRNWCVGYWLPEGFLYDLKKAQIVFDKSAVIRRCIDNLLSNYETTRRKLIEEVEKEIRLKSRTRTDLTYYHAIARSDVLTAFLRLVNLVEGWELTSFKHIDRKIRNTRYAKEIEALAGATDAQFPLVCQSLLQRYFQKND